MDGNTSHDRSPEPELYSEVGDLIGLFKSCDLTDMSITIKVLQACSGTKKCNEIKEKN